ncbi:MAG: large extracellular alpha-helical protein, partial [Deltaproteobacteria bacterium]|nr:large extracellular alpha-helical protein [Deltaproteobacteria bacterium]
MLMTRLFFFLLPLLLFSSLSQAAFDSSVFNQPKALEITRITPEGKEVKERRQIVIQFNQPVVPIGKMERSAEEIPIRITPPLNCEWRWLNTSALACQLKDEDQLSLATEYSMTIFPGIMTPEGQIIKKILQHKIATKRPVFKSFRVEAWRAPGLPLLELSFNQPITKDSLQKTLRLSFSQEGIPEEQTLTYKILDKPESKENLEASSLWQVLPDQEAPLGANIFLKIAHGLVSTYGPLTSNESFTKELSAFPEFEFLGLRCYSNEQDELFIYRKGQTYYTETNPYGKDSKIQEGAIGLCNPLSSVYLVFSGPVVDSQVKNNLTFIPDLAGGRSDYDPWEGRQDYNYWYDETPIRLPVYLKANQTYTLKNFDKIKDEFGRSLKGPTDFVFKTDHRKPNFVLSHEVGVLESQVNSDLPLFVNNIDKVSLNYHQLTQKELKLNQHREIKVPKVEDVQFAIPLGIREILGGQDGLLYGKISTEPKSDRSDWYGEFFVQVTPYQVHAKIGHFNSLVWVTDLATGKPVKDAKVALFFKDINELAQADQPVDQAKTNNLGLAYLKGTSDLDPNLDIISQ